MIVKNANIYDPQKKIFSCKNLYIKDGFIKEENISWELFPSEAEIFDLKGAYIYPAFVDSHCHLIGTGKSLILETLENIDNRKDLKSCLEKYNKYLVLLRGWDDNNLGFFPDRQFLDQTNPYNSILLVRRCGHVGIVNSRCIKELKLENLHGLDGSDLAKGILLERALIEATRKINISTKDEVIYFNKASDFYQNLGISTVHSEDWNIHSILKMESFLLNQKSIRLSESICISNKDELLTWIKIRNSNKNQTNFYNTAFIKLYLDGSLGGETAHLKQPYVKNNSLGTLYFSESELIELITIAESESISIKIHIIGDGALEVAINSFSKSMIPGNPLRHKLVHVQLASTDQLKKILDLNLYLTIQPQFLVSDSFLAPEKLGEKRFKEIGYPFRKMHDMGLKLSFSSDSPIESCNPFLTLKASDKWLDRKTAFSYYSQEAANSIFHENLLGSLNKKKFADAFVYSKDIFSIPSSNVTEIVPDNILFHGQWIKYKKEIS
jgi:predicted amidohydrolase YtcJ